MHRDDPKLAVRQVEADLLFRVTSLEQLLAAVECQSLRVLCVL